MRLPASIRKKIVLEGGPDACITLVPLCNKLELRPFIAVHVGFASFIVNARNVAKLRDMCNEILDRREIEETNRMQREMDEITSKWPKPRK